jgi:hypothetical protein
VGKIDEAHARRLIDEGIAAIASSEESLWRQAMEGPLGRDVRLVHELDAGYQGPAVFETTTAPITLLKEFLESIGALQPEKDDEWWVEPPSSSQVRLDHVSGTLPTQTP